MSTSVLPQLHKIEAELTSQESQLNAQLEEIREKLSGIRAVMPMFSGTFTAAATVVEEDALPEVEETPEAKTVTKKATRAEPKATKAKAFKEKKTAPKESSAKKIDGRAADWQKYTRPGVKNQSMPDAVQLILETQSEKSFTIAEVMDALFKENMPKAQHLKARNRISNVLSGGVRAGDWYKGARGTYRMSAV
jgi:hypothetical protein